jgi:type I restriction enzyme R subunit
MLSDINSEDRLVQATFAEHIEKGLGWDSVYAWNDETFGPDGMLGRAYARPAVTAADERTDCRVNMASLL